MYATIACARMILGYFEPDEHFPIADVKEMTSHRDGCWTFEAQFVPILLQKGYEVILHSDTPYRELAEGKGAERYGKGAEDKINRDALKWALGYLDAKNWKNERPSFNEAVSRFCGGSALMLSASRSVLRGGSELPYCRYNIIVTGVSDGQVRYHDPAAGPHRRASMEHIKKSFEAPGADRAFLVVRADKDE
jgi:hypothetical protein